MLTKVIPQTPPVIPSPLPTVAPVVAFPPSPEVAAALTRAAAAQTEIDRKKAEELARLRAIQDRD
jgi:hypothetical protein